MSSVFFSSPSALPRPRDNGGWPPALRDRIAATVSPSASPDKSTVGDCLLGATLFFATAAVVLWQNLRLGILWDLSYILENSYRISLCDVPYRDFPLP